jgi:MFS family permease
MRPPIATFGDYKFDITNLLSIWQIGVSILVTGRLSTGGRHLGGQKMPDSENPPVGSLDRTRQEQGTYLGELKHNWRALLASALGQGAGLSINGYILSIFAPHLLQTFGWSKAQFALMGTTIMATLFCLPIVGRLTDVFGVRRVALVGVISTPLSYLAFSVFDGDITTFLAITVLQVIFGTTTTATVYSRIVAERFVRARGIALAIVAGWPAVVGAIGVPMITYFIDTHGWRAAYQALAVFSAIVGTAVLFMIPRSSNMGARPVTTPRRARADYAFLARHVTFWLIVAGVFLCNLPQTLNSMQLKLMLLDNGASSADASVMISVFAVGVIIGRFTCGLALDRLPPHLVATVGMGLPSIGMFIIASSIDTSFALSTAALLLGASLGAEGDITAYLVARYFGVQIYSSVLGLMTAVLGIATSIGSVILSITLEWTNHFALFVLFGAVVTVIGSALFMLLGHESFIRRAKEMQLHPVMAPAGLKQESA